MSELFVAMSVMMALGITLLGDGRDRRRPPSGGQSLGSDTVSPDLLQCLPVLGWEGDRGGGRRPTVVTPWSLNLLGSLLDRWREAPHRWIDVVHPADRERVTAAWNRVRAGWQEQELLEYRLIASDNREIWVRDVIRHTVSTVDGASVLHGVWVEITAEKQVVRLDAELRRSQRFEGLGRLMSGIAHDFGNLLTVIVGRSDLIYGTLAADDEQRPAVQAIREAARRATSLVKRLGCLALREADAPGLVDLTRIVSDMHALLRPLMGERIEVVIDAGESAPVVWSERVELERVILNLSVNARDAMPGGGRLLIRILETEVEVDNSADIGVKPGRYGVLEVSDTGCGIERSTHDRIFEPFFTTKGPGAGSGLGLAITRRSAEQHGGGITVKSAVGAGALFRVYLPCCDGGVLAPLTQRFVTRTTPPVARAA